MFTNGKHPYKVSRNSRAQRNKSKMLKGLKIDPKKLQNAFKQMEKEKS